jgi:hypothetical protein
MWMLPRMDASIVILFIYFNSVRVMRFKLDTMGILYCGGGDPEAQCLSHDRNRQSDDREFDGISAQAQRRWRDNSLFVAARHRNCFGKPPDGPSGRPRACCRPVIIMREQGIIY